MSKLRGSSFTGLTTMMMLVLLSIVAPVSAATEAEAAEITQEYDRLQRLWLSEMRLAPDARARELIAQKQPNPAEFAARLKKLLSRDLAHEWTLKYGAWLLEYDRGHKNQLSAGFAQCGAESSSSKLHARAFLCGDGSAQ